MKKRMLLLLPLILALCLTGCGVRDMNCIIQNEPSITGVVERVDEHALLIKNDTGEYVVSLNVENKDSYTDFTVGDEIVVYFDGDIAESYPMQINHVYGIVLRTPAGSE